MSLESLLKNRNQHHSHHRSHRRSLLGKTRNLEALSGPKGIQMRRLAAQGGRAPQALADEAPSINEELQAHTWKASTRVSAPRLADFLS